MYLILITESHNTLYVTTYCIHVHVHVLLISFSLVLVEASWLILVLANAVTMELMFYTSLLHVHTV